MFRINFKYSLLTFLGLVALVCFAAAPAYSQTSDPQKVFVVNTTSTPVPTVAQGTTKVAGSILVGNTAAAPVVVRDVDVNGDRVINRCGAIHATANRIGACAGVVVAVQNLVQRDGIVDGNSRNKG